MPDNVPQWHCQGIFRGTDIQLTMMGDDVGLIDMQAQVPPTTDPKIAIGAFEDLLSATPAFVEVKPAMLDWIKSWSGSRGQVMKAFQNATAAISFDATWIILIVDRVPRFGMPGPS